ncbi:monovalent cation/H(+) antiporter subunit G, partial [Pseudomonadota bacterium]
PIRLLLRIQFGSFFIITGAIGFLRMEDFFIKLHAIVLSNCYGITFILIGFIIKNSFEISLLKFFIIIILNILVTLVSIHAVGRRAYIENTDIRAKRRDEVE